MADLEGCLLLPHDWSQHIDDIIPHGSSIGQSKSVKVRAYTHTHTHDKLPYVITTLVKVLDMYCLVGICQWTLFCNELRKCNSECSM